MNVTSIDVIMWIIAAILATALWLEIVRRYNAAREEGRRWLKDEGYIASSPEEQRQKRVEESYKRLVKE